MAGQKKGEITKRKIIESSKKLFYTKGYNKTLMQNIADDAEIALGTLTYHYSKKESIASTILYNYITNINTYIDQHSESNLNAFQTHFIASIPYYKNLLEDQHSRQFYCEVIMSETLYSGDVTEDPLALFFKGMKAQCLRDYRIPKMGYQLELASIFEVGGRNRLIKKYTEGKLKNISIENIANYLSSNMGKLLHIPEDEIIASQELAIQFNNEHDLSQIHALL